MGWLYSTMAVNLKYKHFLYPIITEKPQVAEGEPEPFGNRIELAFGAVILVPTSNYWSQVIESNGKTQIQV
jgi:hypothetical protein